MTDTPYERGYSAGKEADRLRHMDTMAELGRQLRDAQEELLLIYGAIEKMFPAVYFISKHSEGTAPVYVKTSEHGTRWVHEQSKCTRFMTYREAREMADRVAGGAVVASIAWGMKR